MKIFNIFNKNFTTSIKNLKPLTINHNKFLEVEIENKDNTNLRVDRFIANKYGLHWDSIQKYFRNNDIFIIRNQFEKIKNPTEKLILNDKVYIFKRIFENENNNRNKEKDLENIDEVTQNNLEKIFTSMIVLESNEILVINKMTNIASQNGTNIKFSIDTMLKIMNNNYTTKFNLKLVHRLDKNVSGLMILGNEIDSVRKLGENIKESKIEKTYYALVQNIPIYLKHMIKNNKINLNNTEHFAKSLLGYIKSNEECDTFVIEMENRNNYVYDSKFDNNYSIIKNNNYINPESLNMFGKFKIMNFIFYDKNKKEFKLFKMDLNNLLNSKLENLNNLQIKLNEMIDVFDKNSHMECYSLIKYELVSGKKHQIRKHMSKCFFSPIFNDMDYGFDQEISHEGFKIFNSSTNLSNLKKDEFYEKYKINDFSKSIALQSVQIDLPKMNMTDLKIKNKQINFSVKNDDKLQINLLNFSEIFNQLFHVMKLNKEDLLKL